jgi:hypothetical protein
VPHPLAPTERRTSGKHDCPDRRVDGQTHNAANKVKIEARQKPIASNDADACLADNPKPAPRASLLDKISGSRADQQDHDYTFVAKCTRFLPGAESGHRSQAPEGTIRA